MTLEAFIALITGGGPFVLAAVFAVLWWRSDEERKAKEVLFGKLLERTINALNTNANALGDLRVYLGMERERHDKEGR